MVPARKIRSDCLRFLPAPLGAWVGKILILLRFTDAPGFAEPTPPVRILTGGPRASPTQFRKVFLRTVGEGLKVNRPKAERSHPGVCPRRRSSERNPLTGGPVWDRPLRRSPDRLLHFRRAAPCGLLQSLPLEAGNTGVDEDSPLRRPHVFPQKQKRRTALFRGRPALFDGCGYFSRPEKNRMNTMAHTAMR